MGFKPALVPSIFFADGCVVDRDHLVAPAGFNAFPDAPATRIALWLDGAQFHHDVRGDSLRSVTFHPVDQRCYLAGRHGMVYRAGDGRRFGAEALTGSWHGTQLDAVERRGELTRIRSIGRSVFVCGDGGQMYRLDGDQWVPAEVGLDGTEVFEDLDGVADDDVWAVGIGGLVLRWDGARWRPGGSPTARHLSNVRCVGRGEIYLCGNDGAFFRGDGERWTDLGDPSFRSHWWGMALHADQVWLASSDGLATWVDGALRRVDLGVPGRFTFHRMDARDGVLVSFGTDHILQLDQDGWSELAWPDNAPRTST